MKAIILPGMGGNSNMYPYEEYRHLEDVSFINWPSYNGEASLLEVAKGIVNQYQINSEMVVGGASLGGMVAIEIAKLTGIKKVVLIGSATTPDSINPLLKKIRNLANITPVKIIQIFAGKVNLYASSDILSMFEESDSRFIKAMCKALFKWEGLANYKCEVCQIHGQKDKVILPPKENVEIIPDGSHLISMTHAKEVSSFLHKNMQ